MLQCYFKRIPWTISHFMAIIMSMMILASSENRASMRRIWISATNSCFERSNLPHEKDQNDQADKRMSAAWNTFSVLWQKITSRRLYDHTQGIKLIVEAYTFKNNWFVDWHSTAIISWTTESHISKKSRSNTSKSSDLPRNQTFLSFHTRLRFSECLLPW